MLLSLLLSGCSVQPLWCHGVRVGYIVLCDAAACSSGSGEILKCFFHSLGCWHFGFFSLFWSSAAAIYLLREAKIKGKGKCQRKRNQHVRACKLVCSGKWNTVRGFESSARIFWWFSLLADDVLDCQRQRWGSSLFGSPPLMQTPRVTWLLGDNSVLINCANRFGLRTEGKLLSHNTDVVHPACLRFTAGFHSFDTCLADCSWTNDLFLDCFHL